MGCVLMAKICFLDSSEFRVLSYEVSDTEIKVENPKLETRNSKHLDVQCSSFVKVISPALIATPSTFSLGGRGQEKVSEYAQYGL